MAVQGYSQVVQQQQQRQKAAAVLERAGVDAGALRPAELLRASAALGSQADGRSLKVLPGNATTGGCKR